jgi:VWFA-related protein
LSGGSYNREAGVWRARDIFSESMLNHSRSAVLALACAFAAQANPAWAQVTGPAPSQKSQESALTLHATAQIVLTDVLVTDGKGNPVQGLKESDFHIYDDGKPQKILSFEEHRTKDVASSPSISTAPDVYSNAFMEHLPPIMNIVVIDTTGMGVADQMYLRYEMNRFIKQLPLGEPIAIYWRTGDATLLLQNFSSDRAQLLAAVQKAIPYFWPFGKEHYSYISTLERIAVDFGQYPGRKNVLWITGGTTPSLTLNPADLGPAVWVDPVAIHNVYDLLEACRIAVYPMSVRGLGLVNWNMSQVAESTGGQTYYGGNGLDLMAEQWLKNSGDYYTITYSPLDDAVNNKWHKVQVKLNRRWHKDHLSYRRGYFADGMMKRKRAAKKLRALLLANGKAAKQQDLRGEPIIFYAKVMPAAEMTGGPIAANAPPTSKPRHGMVSYMVHYMLPSKYFDTTMLHGKTQLVLGVSAIAFSQKGTAEAEAAYRLTLKMSPEKLREDPKYVIPIDQYIDLPAGQSYLSLAVWDEFTRRVGTLQIPLLVLDPQQAK